MRILLGVLLDERGIHTHLSYNHKLQELFITSKTRYLCIILHNVCIVFFFQIELQFSQYIYDGFASSQAWGLAPPTTPRALGGSSSSQARGWVQQNTRQAFGASSSSQAWGMDATSAARLVSILRVGRRKQLDVSLVICLVPC